MHPDPKEVPTLMRVEQIADVPEGLKQRVKGSGSDTSQMGLEFREGHFDGVEIGAVGGQEQEPATALSQGLCRALALMDVSRFDAAPLIAFIAAKETNYGTETDGRIPC